MGQVFSVDIQKEISMNKVGLCVSTKQYKQMTRQDKSLNELMSESNIFVFNTGIKMRQSIGNKEIGEVWIHSCEDVEPINLAASLKGDDPSKCITLVAEERCGSLLSRANAAGIDRVVESEKFMNSIQEASALKSSFSSRSENEESGHGKEEDGLKALESDLLHAFNHDREANNHLDSMQEPYKLNSVSRIPLFGQSKQIDPDDRSLFDTNEGSRSIDINDAVAQVSVQKKEGRAFIMSIFSGSGGAGKSSIAVTTALLLKRRGVRTLLFDCDLQFGDIRKMVNVSNVLECDKALRQPEKLKELAENESVLSILAAPERLENSEKIAVQLASLLNYLSGHFEAIIINTGGAWSEQHAILLECSGASLFLVDQRASSVHACKHALELCSRCGIATSPFYFALNRCKRGNPLSSIDVSCALEGAAVYEIKDGGNEIEEYLSSGDGEGLIDLKNDYIKSVDQMLCSIAPRFNDKSSRLFNLPEEGRLKNREKKQRRIWGKRK